MAWPFTLATATAASVGIAWEPPKNETMAAQRPPPTIAAKMMMITSFVLFLFLRNIANQPFPFERDQQGNCTLNAGFCQTHKFCLTSQLLLGPLPEKCSRSSLSLSAKCSLICAL